MMQKRKKVSKYRGSKTHGCGSMKKRRGAGNRGGRGMAGSGKRADQKKPSILKEYGSSYFGKKGFASKNKEKIRSINVGDLENKLITLLKKELAKNENGIIKIDLSKLKFNKLLGAGKITRKFEINVDQASKMAIEKIEKIGGKVNVNNRKSD
jgi:large subunit ribosomal protein L15